MKNKRQSSLLMAIILPAAILLHFSLLAQPLAPPAASSYVRRLDNTKISVDDLTARIKRLMETAEVTGMAVSIFNDKQPVYTRAFGYAVDSIRQKMDTTTEFWACSFSKAIFA